MAQKARTPDRQGPLPAEAQLEGFISKFTPEVAGQARAAFVAMRERLPTATILVYDNYNALAIGFAPNERASDAILSLAIFPRWVSLFFLQGVGLPDPVGLLKGAGTKARHIVLKDVAILRKSAVQDLIDAALAGARVPLPAAGEGRVVVKSVSEKQRPRRP
jgi:hypothetical protein